MCEKNNEQQKQAEAIPDELLEQVAGGEGERRKKRHSDDITTPEI